MEEKKSLINPISEEDFTEKVHDMAQAAYQAILEDLRNGILHLRDYSGVSKFKSIRRAIKRGHVSVFGEVYPKRPFKNIKVKKGTPTYRRKKLYEQLKQRNKSS